MRGVWLWIPVEPALGKRLYAAMAKGKGHKYVKRVPTGNPKRPWRYYYAVQHGGGISNRSHLTVGASFADASIGSHAGHWHIVAKDGDRFTIRHDETKEERSFDHEGLVHFLTTPHAAASAEVAKKRKESNLRALAEARQYGSKRHVEAARKRARAVGATDDEVMTEDEREDAIALDLAHKERALQYMINQAQDRPHIGQTDWGMQRGEAPIEPLVARIKEQRATARRLASEGLAGKSRSDVETVIKHHPDAEVREQAKAEMAKLNAIAAERREHSFAEWAVQSRLSTMYDESGRQFPALGDSVFTNDGERGTIVAAKDSRREGRGGSALRVQTRDGKNLPLTDKWFVQGDKPDLPMHQRLYMRMLRLQEEVRDRVRRARSSLKLTQALDQVRQDFLTLHRKYAMAELGLSLQQVKQAEGHGLIFIRKDGASTATFITKPPLEPGEPNHQRAWLDEARARGATARDIYDAVVSGEVAREVERRSAAWKQQRDQREQASQEREVRARADAEAQRKQAEAQIREEARRAADEDDKAIDWSAPLRQDVSEHLRSKRTSAANDVLGFGGVPGDDRVLPTVFTQRDADGLAEWARGKGLKVYEAAYVGGGRRTRIIIEDDHYKLTRGFVSHAPELALKEGASPDADTPLRRKYEAILNRRDAARGQVTQSLRDAAEAQAQRVEEQANARKRERDEHKARLRAMPRPTTVKQVAERVADAVDIVTAGFRPEVKADPQGGFVLSLAGEGNVHVLSDGSRHFDGHVPAPYREAVEKHMEHLGMGERLPDAVPASAYGYKPGLHAARPLPAKLLEAHGLAPGGASAKIAEKHKIIYAESPTAHEGNPLLHVTGNTYAHRDAIRSAINKFRRGVNPWRGASKAWEMRPEELVDALRRIEGKKELAKGLGRALKSVAQRLVGRSMAPMWLRIPAFMAKALGRRLLKAAHHKYVKRVPTGNPKRPWRYFYHAAHGKGVAHHDDMKVGASFRIKDAGKEGHFHIVAEHDGGHVTVKHDESGTEHKLHRDALGAMLTNEHAEALGAARAKTLEDLKTARVSGSPKQVARLESEAQRRGVVEPVVAPPPTPAPAAKPVTVEHSFVEREGTDAHHKGSIYRNGKGGKVYVSLRYSARKGHSNDEDFGIYGSEGKRVASVTAREATPDEVARFEAWEKARDAGLEHVQANEFSTTHGAKALLEDEGKRSPEIHPRSSGEVLVVKPANKWGYGQHKVHIDPAGGKIVYARNMDSYDDPRGWAVYEHPYSDELAQRVRDAHAEHERKTSEAVAAINARRPRVTIAASDEADAPVANDKPRKRQAEPKEAPKLQFRHTREGGWAVFGPAKHIKAGQTHTVHKRDGSISEVYVSSVSRPFKVDGVPHVYGFMKGGASVGFAPLITSDAFGMRGQVMSNGDIWEAERALGHRLGAQLQRADLPIDWDVDAVKPLPPLADDWLGEWEGTSGRAALGDWVELNDEIGAILFALQIDALAKGRLKKYIKRIATGNPKRPWRYFYSVAQERADKAKAAAESERRKATPPVQFVDKHLEETWKVHYDAHPDDDSVPAGKPHGKPSQERFESVHKPIIEDAFAKSDGPQKRPVAIVMMGGPGSGKSSILEHLSLPKGAVLVDPDEVKKQMPEYKAALADRSATPKTAALQVHFESAAIARDIRDRAIAQKHHVVIDGTGRHAPSMIAMVKNLKSKGYFVRLVHVHCDADEGLRRAKERALSTGRYVPDDVVTDTYADIPASFDQVKRHVHAYGSWTTSRTPSGERGVSRVPVKIVSKRVGGQEEVHHAKLNAELNGGGRRMKLVPKRTGDREEGRHVRPGPRDRARMAARRPKA